MPRPHRCRRVTSEPRAVFFKPVGIPLRQLEEVSLTLDQFEALRLADLEGLYQQDSAVRMGISRPTFSRLIAEARGKVAEFLVRGAALRIEGGTISVQRAGNVAEPKPAQTPADSGCSRPRRQPGQRPDRISALIPVDPETIKGED